MTGAASKGVIWKGVVTAEELGSDGAVLRAVATGETDAAGQYSLTLNDTYQGGPVRVRITADADTLMKCDAITSCGSFESGDANDSDRDGTIDRGEWFAPDISFSMQALVAKANANDKLSVSITPYTDMAATHAKTLGLTAENIAVANSKVSNLLGGVDILATKPIDVTNPAAMEDATQTELAYGILTAAVTGLAESSGTGSTFDVGAAVSALSMSFANGTMAATSTDSTPSLEAIVTAANTQATTSGIASPGVQLVLDALADTVTNNPDGITPQPSDTASATEIAKVKGFISDLRTWGTTIALETDAKASAFENEVELASQLASGFNEFTFQDALSASLNAVLMADGSNTDLSSYDVGYPSRDVSGIKLHFNSGTINIDQRTVTIHDAEFGHFYMYSEDPGEFHPMAKVNMTAVLPADGESDTVTFRITSAVVEHPAAKLTINDGTVSVTLAEPYNVDVAAMLEGTAAPIPELTGGSFVLDATLNQLKTQGPAGFVEATNPIAFAGTIDLSVTSNVAGQVLPTSVKLSGAVSDQQGNSLEADLIFNLTNAASYTLDEVDEYMGTSENWADIDLGLSFKAQLAGLPEATFTLTGDRTGFEAGKVALSIAYGARRLELSELNLTATGVEGGTITITNQDGVKLNLVPKFSDGADAVFEDASVTYNGQSYATISELSNGLLKVSYNDGTFEIL